MLNDKFNDNWCFICQKEGDRPHICNSCKEFLDHGFLALVVGERSQEHEGSIVRTGSHTFVHHEVFEEIFDIDLPEDKEGLVFVDQDTFDDMSTVKETYLH